MEDTRKFLNSKINQASQINSMNVQDFFNNIFLFIIQKLTEPFISIYFFISHKCKELFHNLYLFIVQKFSELFTSIYFFINHNFMEPFNYLYLFIIQKFKELFTNMYFFINHNFMEPFNNLCLFIIQKFSELLTSIYFFINHNFMEPFNNLYLFIVQKFKELFTNIYFFINHNIEEPFNNFYLFIIRKFNEILPIETRSQTLNHWARIFFFVILPVTLLLVCLYKYCLGRIKLGSCLRRCFLCCCGNGRMMRAPGRYGQFMPRSYFESNPMRYFKEKTAEEPLISTNHDSHVNSIQTPDDDSIFSSVIVEPKETLLPTPYSHVISIKLDNEESSADKSSRSKYSSSNTNETGKEKKIRRITIPHPKVKRKVKTAEEPLISTNHDSHVNSIQTPDDDSICSSAIVESKETHLPTPYSHVISTKLDDEQSSADKSSRSKYSSSNSNETGKEKKIRRITIPRPQVKREVKTAEEPLISTNHDSHVISIQTSDGDSTCSSAIVESKEALLPTPYSHFISIKLDDEESSAGKSSCSKYSSSNFNETGKEKKIRRITIPRPQVKREGKWLRHYCSNHSILLVGEGDFSFSACLAKAFGSATTMVATSLDSMEFLARNYPGAKSNIGCLKKSGCIVLHGVDATIMKLNISVNEFIYDRIIFNFPLAGFFKEPRRQTLKRNRELVLSFMENASAMIASDGEIHITHKTSSLYQEWGIENLAKCRLRLIEDVEFKLTDYPGYHNKYGFGGNRNFDYYPSRTFKFRLK